MSALPSSLAAGLPPDTLLLPALADALPTGVVCAAPVAEAGQVVDFALAYLNPAARRLLGVPAPPPATYAQLFPASRSDGRLAQLTAAYHDPQRGAWPLADPGRGAAAFRTTGQRVDDLLLLLLTPTEEAQVARLTQELADARVDAERQRERLVRLFQQAPALVNTQLGPEHVFELVHPLTYQLLGHRPLVGLPSRQALPELEGPFHELLDQVYQSGQPFYGREVHARLDRQGDGHLDDAYFDFTYQPLLGADGLVEGVMTFAVEVTAQMRARQQVEQLNQELEARVAARTRQVHLAHAEAEAQRQRLAQLFQQAPAAICILSGPELVYELVNPAYQQLFPGRALRGRPLLQALPELADQPVWHTLQQVLRTGQTHREFGMHVPVARTEGGPLEDFYLTYVQQARRDAHGRVDGVVVFAFDITEQVLARRQVEQLTRELAAANAELHESNARLRRSNDDLDTFVYTASHDLQAPITNLGGLLQVLREETAAGQWSDTAGHALTLMQDAVDRFRTTLGHLTEVTRLQPDAAPAAPVDLADVIAGVQLDLAPLLAASRARLTIDAAACPAVLVPAKTLRSVVYNLLSNALKYRHPERPAEIRIRCRREDQQDVLEVEDNGLGIDLQRQPDLFGLFRRYHTHVEGSGVGLYMVKRMVEHAGGRIGVRSQPGQGTTFTVTFPDPRQ